MKIATDPQKTPVLVHCLHGSDRTGAMCAAYRIVVQGWSKGAAIAKIKHGGYGHHKIRGNLGRWIEGVDIDATQSGNQNLSVAL
ncbi:MAG: protein tyrosine/serine phosphatase [Akkermansiaceae bacterium]